MADGDIGQTSLMLVKLCILTLLSQKAEGGGGLSALNFSPKIQHDAFSKTASATLENRLPNISSSKTYDKA